MSKEFSLVLSSTIVSGTGGSLNRSTVKFQYNCNMDWIADLNYKQAACTGCCSTQFALLDGKFFLQPVEYNFLNRKKKIYIPIFEGATYTPLISREEKIISKSQMNSPQQYFST